MWCEIFHSDVDKDCSLKEYEAMLYGNLSPLFQGSLLPPSSG